MMFPKERERGSSSGLGQGGEVDVENLSFFKIFQGEDLSAESMRAFPYDFIRNVPQDDFSSNMVIRTQCGLSWEVKVSMNPCFYYMEKRGWNQFVNDNALGDKELVTFTHTGLMCFNVNIYEENGKEVVTPRRRPRTMASLSGIKKEAGKSSNKDVKKAEKTGGVKKEVGESSKRDVKKAEEIAESTRGDKLKSKRCEGGETSKKKKKKMKSNNVEHTVPVFSVTLTASYLKFLLPIPRYFAEEHISNQSKRVTIHHLDGNCSWEVLCLVRKRKATFSSGWATLAREYPLSVGDICAFKLIKPTEFQLLVTGKVVEEIMTD
ncbi:B3 domain-containing protein [Raphanus sativus]|uniref:B3 domain-containing protein At3g17010 n=1 Tax=Raphanus sativus TaxID=3726 RepID=A0A6J0JE94_RAPSA|nr:B3 domain-containing protein At3g17010 [Raphanus sativus]KAJ4868759.1 B3 domain-containing protein [Raphanus sativus]